MNPSGVSNDATAADVFLYTAGAFVPHDVVQVRVDDSVTTIPAYAFHNRAKLVQLELCEGLQVIEERAFFNCQSLGRVKIPSTVTQIDSHAFQYCHQLHEVEFGVGLEVIGCSGFEGCRALKHVILPNNLKRIEQSAFACNKFLCINIPDSVEDVGDFAFQFNEFPTLKVPPRITSKTRWLASCPFLFSVELPEDISTHHSVTYSKCRSLRNIAFHPDIELDPATLYGELFDQSQNMDLRQLFDSEVMLQIGLKHRFDELPIHKILYYHDGTVESLNNVIGCQSGRERDCLGMTPLHILACSTKQDKILYRMIIDNYPENLVTKDGWGALPLLYAVWGNAPSEIIQFLIESYRTKHPTHQLDWEGMLETLCTRAPVDTIKNLFDVQRNYFPDQGIEWHTMLLLPKMEGADADTRTSFPTVETYKFLLKCSISERLRLIGIKKWQEHVTMQIDCNYCIDLEQRQSIYAMLEDYEAKYDALKEATSSLELILWKNKINECGTGQPNQTERNGGKRVKLDTRGFREQCRISCESATVIENVLPYLIHISQFIEI